MKFSEHDEHSLIIRLIFNPKESQSLKIINSDSIRRFLCATIRHVIFRMAGRILRTQFLHGRANIAHSIFAWQGEYCALKVILILSVSITFAMLLIGLIYILL